MEYFRIQQDSANYPSPEFDLFSVKGAHEAVRGDFSKMERMVVSFISHKEEHVFPSIIDRHIFMVRKELKQVLDIYEPGLDYSNVCLLDKQMGKHPEGHCYYYLPHIKQVPALLDENNNGLLTLKQSVLEGITTDLFQVTSRDKTIFVASLALVESMLRRKIEGLILSSVQVDTMN